MVKGKWMPQGSDIGEALRIREAVLGKGRDALDEQAQQVLVYQGDRPVGAARLWWAEGAFHLGEVCVLEEDRHQGFGDLLVRLALYKALSHHARQVRLSAPRTVAPFFRRYGFAPEQEPLEREGTPWVDMSLSGNAISLSPCGNLCKG